MEATLENWPPIEGRYRVGNRRSPIAVCTCASIDEIKINPQKVAIWGKTVTENIGLEKLIQNIVSNSNIRYLIICGRKSKGHFVGQALIALKKNGVDKEKRIIGAKGSMPYLRNLKREIIERFRNQIEPIDLRGETSSSKIEEVINQLLKVEPGKFRGEAIKIKRVEEVEAKPEKWIADPNGYFLISFSEKGDKIIVEHYFKNGKINKKIAGREAKAICDTIARFGLIGNFEQTLGHAMYLARELQKAEMALKNRLVFEQDQELKIQDGKEEAAKKDELDWFD